MRNNSPSELWLLPVFAELCVIIRCGLEGGIQQHFVRLKFPKALLQAWENTDLVRPLDFLRTCSSWRTIFNCAFVNRLTLYIYLKVSKFLVRTLPQDNKKTSFFWNSRHRSTIFWQPLPKKYITLLHCNNKRHIKNLTVEKLQIFPVDFDWSIESFAKLFGNPQLHKVLECKVLLSKTVVTWGYGGIMNNQNYQQETRWHFLVSIVFSKKNTVWKISSIFLCFFIKQSGTNKKYFSILTTWDI